MLKYTITCWIPVDPEEEELYESLEDARKDLEHYQLLQPENIYKIDAVNDQDAEDRGSLEGCV